MTKYQNSRHNMIVQVLLVMETNKVKVEAVPVMKTAVDNLKASSASTEQLMQKLDGIPAKYSKNKNMIRTDLIDIALKVSNITMAFAKLSRNEVLKNILLTSETPLRGMNDLQLNDYAKNLVEHVTAHKVVLATYGLTEDMETELATESADFSRVISEPRAIVTDRKTQNELLSDSLETSLDILRDQLDHLMEMFLDDREFYIAYKSARMVVDPKYGTRKEDNVDKALVSE